MRVEGRSLRVLDLGCGIGRHVIYAHEMGFEAYGLDHSAVAVELARQWAARVGIPVPEERIVEGDVRALPWPNGYFDAIVSHGVLDSMPFEVARAGMSEVERVLSLHGLMYADLVAGPAGETSRSDREEVVKTRHERGTVQSYFNEQKVDTLIEGRLALRELVLVSRETKKPAALATGRYHLVAERSDAPSGSEERHGGRG
jgi:SAM-dependent methyltransferase